MILDANTPTNFSDNGQMPSTFDLALIKNIVRLCDIETVSLPSDHIRLIYSFGNGRDMRRREYKFRDVIKRADWKRFRESLNNHWTMTMISIPPTSWSSWSNALTNKILSAADKCVPYNTINLQKNNA
ncbi:hypothetical protein Trydic_g17562 [Trypoxylus dichotomus]